MTTKNKNCSFLIEIIQNDYFLIVSLSMLLVALINLVYMLNNKNCCYLIEIIQDDIFLIVPLSMMLVALINFVYMLNKKNKIRTQKTFYEAIENRDYNDALLHFENTLIDPSIDNQKAIILAIRKNYLFTNIKKFIYGCGLCQSDKIISLLLTDKRVDPSTMDNFCIRYACCNGLTDIVNILLKDKRIDPSTLDNFCIRCAAQRGYKEVVELLLKDKRVDPSKEYS